VHRGEQKMKQLSLLALVFAFLSLIFFLLLIVLRIPFLFYPLMSCQDAADLLTPLVLIPMYWLMFKYAASRESSRIEEIVFVVFAAIWVLGHGMHLAANSINNLAEALARKQRIDILGTNLYQLTYFYDEHLSHYLWHSGVLGLAGLLIYREWRNPRNITTIWWITIPAGFLYGITWFCIFLEGQTVLLGLPFAILITVLTPIWGRAQLAQRPFIAFFFISCLVAVVLFVGWGLYWGGFPQFTDVGLI
jgi:hypothetical protein